MRFLILYHTEMVGHIRNYFDMMSKILREESEGDLMYYLESIDTPQEAMKVIETLRDRLVEMSYNDMTRRMLEQHYDTKTELLARFEFITEKQRGYPLWMWEYSDIEDWASSWAESNWYGYLFREE